MEYGRFVDATHSKMQAPATTPPPYAVADDVTCVPVGRLPAVAARFDHFTVVGAGKTGMDACRPGQAGRMTRVRGASSV